MVTKPRVIRMAPWATAAVVVACVLTLGAGALLWRTNASGPWRAGAVAMAVLGVLGLLDAACSRIVLEEQTLRVESLVRRRRYARDGFLAAKVDGGAVCLQRREGGWVKLPSTGHNALAVRNTVHAWITGLRPTVGARSPQQDNTAP